MNRFEEIKNEMDCWDHCDSYYSYWHNYIKEDMVRWLISENERLRKDLECYGSHATTCDFLLKHSDGIRAKCSCGFQQALKEEE